MRPLVAATAILALATLGCRAVHMQVDPRIAASSKAYDVSGANRRAWTSPISFGPWTMFPLTGDAQSDWSRRAVGGETESNSQHPFAFLMEGPGVTFEAECDDAIRAPMTLYVVSEDQRERRGTRVLACAFRREGAPISSVWALAVHTRSDGGFTGELSDPSGTTAYAVRSSHRIEGMPIESGRPVGWTLDGREAGAAVETVGTGRVFLPSNVTEVPILASTAAALFLFEADMQSRDRVAPDAGAGSEAAASR